MASPFSVSIDLDKLDFERTDIHERVVPGGTTVMSVITVGWMGDLVISGTDADRFEQVAEWCMDAARGLRIVNGVAEKVDELDPFGREVA